MLYNFGLWASFQDPQNTLQNRTSNQAALRLLSMYQEHPSAESRSAMELPYFFKKRDQPIVIDIQCDPGSSDGFGQNASEPSFRESVEFFFKEFQDLEETKRNSSHSDSIDLDRKKSKISSTQQGYSRTSNCQFDLNSSLSPSHNHSKSQTSILSEVTLKPQARQKETTGKKALDKIFQRLMEERVLGKRIRQTIAGFNERYGEGGLIDGLKQELSIAKSPSNKALKNCSDPRQKQQRRSTFYSKKITRRQFRQLRPFLDQSAEDKDIEEDLRRIESAKYRYQSSVLATVISKLASKVNPKRMQTDKTVMVPEHPPISLSSVRHPMMVRILKERLKKRQIICVD